jgi:hypothetical protein
VRAGSLRPTLSPSLALKPTPEGSRHATRGRRSARRRQRSATNEGWGRPRKPPCRRASFARIKGRRRQQGPPPLALPIPSPLNPALLKTLLQHARRASHAPSPGACGPGVLHPQPPVRRVALRPPSGSHELTAADALSSPQDACCVSSTRAISCFETFDSCIDASLASWSSSASASTRSSSRGRSARCARGPDRRGLLVRC